MRTSADAAIPIGSSVSEARHILMADGEPCHFDWSGRIKGS